MVCGWLQLASALEEGVEDTESLGCKPSQTQDPATALQAVGEACGSVVPSIRSESPNQRLAICAPMWPGHSEQGRGRTSTSPSHPQSPAKAHTNASKDAYRPLKTCAHMQMHKCQQILIDSVPQPHTKTGRSTKPTCTKTHGSSHKHPRCLYMQTDAHTQADLWTHGHT